VGHCVPSVRAWANLSRFRQLDENLEIVRKVPKLDRSESSLFQ
jgi:hypothetical protein